LFHRAELREAYFKSILEQQINRYFLNKKLEKESYDLDHSRLANFHKMTKGVLQDNVSQQIARLEIEREEILSKPK
jgi:hypothetical protein